MAIQTFYCIEMTIGEKYIGGVIYTRNDESTAGKTVYDSYYKVTPENNGIPVKVILTPAGNSAMMMQKDGTLNATIDVTIHSCWSFHADPESSTY